MFFSLYPHARRLQRLLERLLVCALAGTLLAAALLAVLLVLPDARLHETALQGLAAVLVALRLAQTYYTRRRVQQTALEAHLLQQPLGADTLAACLQRDDHLWAQSLILKSLRLAEAQPSPGRLRPDEHLRRLHALFSARLRPLRPLLLRPGLFVLAALLALWTFDAPPGALSLRYGLAFSAALLVVEVVEARLAWRAQDVFDDFTLALSGWTLDHTARTPAKPHAYQHQRLYLDRPWATA